MTTKEYLKQARTLKVCIDGKIERIRQLREFMTRTTPHLGRDPVSGGHSNGFGELCACIVDFERELTGDLEELYRLQLEIDRAIKQVPDDRYRVLLELYYLNGYTWDQVAEAMSYNDRWVRRMHGYALLAIEGKLALKKPA